ncbi:SecDF P1 head subdomain-containing protein [Sphingopyxis sp.]|uniref:SecDF P1 head subdomain-containing protein n=1 Tax=Sphingopyxis sp. TaxID=1908224 RepID=UPI002ED82AB2
MLAAQIVGEPVVASEKGIWIGNLDLCRSDPVKAVAGIETLSGLPIVSITLPASLHGALEKLTTANIGKPLSIRVDGRIVSEPYVNEPIVNGELQISGIDQAEADRIAAALQGCSEEKTRTAG